jgi:ribosomal protein S18 acetylase RimI-like enzyme
MDKNLIQVSSDLELRAAAIEDLAAVSAWFVPRKLASSVEERYLIRQWAGPKISYPCSAEQLAFHVMNGNYQSFTLAENNNIVGFGQIQLVKQRAHLARLVINPKCRGLGLAKRLLSELIENAQQQIQVKEVSLFVYLENTTAIACYTKFGFAESATPPGINALDGCRFMTLRY